MSLLRSPKLRWLRCGLLAGGLGLLAGACEALQIGLDIRLDLSFGQAFVLALVTSACGGARGAGVGAARGLPQ